MDRLLQPDRGFQDGSLPQQRLIDHVGFFDGPPKDDGGIGFTDAMRAIIMLKRLAASVVFATRIRPLVSRSSRFTKEIRAPFTISKARKRFSSSQRVLDPPGRVGWTRRFAGLSMTRNRSSSYTMKELIPRDGENGTVDFTRHEDRL